MPAPHCYVPPSSSTQRLSKSQRRSVLSFEPVTIRRLWGKTASASTISTWSSKVRTGVVLGMSCDILLEVVEGLWVSFPKLRLWCVHCAFLCSLILTYCIYIDARDMCLITSSSFQQECFLRVIAAFLVRLVYSSLQLPDGFPRIRCDGAVATFRSSNLAESYLS
jgi:hypothetical protein